MCEKFFAQIISRSDAKLVGSKFYYTGKPCKNGHNAIRWVSSYQCLICEKDKQGTTEKKEYRKKYYRENKDHIDKKSLTYQQENYNKYIASQRRYYRENKEEVNKRNNDYYYENIESMKAAQKKWYEENRQHVLERERKRRSSREYKDSRNIKSRERYKNDVNYKMKLHMRAMLSRTIGKFGRVKSSRTVETLGYDSPELVAHLESRMLDGMSWDNYGEWNIDHIEPIHSFVSRGDFSPDRI